MKKKLLFAMTLVLAFLVIMAGTPLNVHADGTEELGIPSIEILPGSGFVTAGTGLFAQPGVIDIDVPGDVQQALLYWQCQPGDADGGDDTITVNGSDVTGLTIGGPTQTNQNGLHSVTYRADITGMVSSGENTLIISDFDCIPNVIPLNNGAGVLVIYDDGTPSDVQVRDGNDYAYCQNRLGNPDLKETVEQMFTFAPSDFARNADLSLFASSVEGIASGPVRPSRVEVTVGSDVTRFDNVLNSNDGDEWDTFTETINIPAGEEALTVEVISLPGEPGDPVCASLAWNTAGLSVPEPFCGDGNVDPEETCDPPGEPQGLPNECRDDCTFCGDGIEQPTEECDDGNNEDGDGCSATCTVEPECGDGNLDPGETCDPPGEPQGMPDECRDDCTFCGDGIEQPSEECDDGNNADGDGCQANCVLPECGDNIVDPGETCDPPGEPQGMPDECRDDCTFCGDGVLDPSEECDDGNNDDGDGCSAVCTMEDGGEGCTPGYWKQCQHFGSWTPPLTPDTKFSMMFGSSVFGDMTLLEVLGQGGGGINALGRHAVAALLNAASPDVSYDRTTDQVKMMFNNALAGGTIEEVKDILEGFNEQECPIGLNPGDNCNEKDNEKIKDK